MNNVVLNGYIVGKVGFGRNKETGKMEAGFLVSAYSPFTREAENFPCLFRSDTTKLQQHARPNAYVEIEGALTFNSKGIIIDVEKLYIQPPQQEDFIYLRQNDFLNIHSPKEKKNG